MMSAILLWIIVSLTFIFAITGFVLHFTTKCKCDNEQEKDKTPSASSMAKLMAKKSDCGSKNKWMDCIKKGDPKKCLPLTAGKKGVQNQLAGCWVDKTSEKGDPCYTLSHEGRIPLGVPMSCASKCCTGGFNEKSK